MTVEKNIVSYETLYPENVLGGVEVKDDLIDPNNTWSSSKIKTELDELEEGLTQAIEDIDLSPYATNTALSEGLAAKQNSLGYTAENTANKNVANGYLGLQNHMYYVHINFLQNNLVYSNPYLYNSTTTSGAGTYTSAGSANTPKLRTGNDTQFRLPTMNLVGSTTGHVTCALNGVPAMTLKSPYKLLSEQTFSYTDLGSKNNSFVICLGDGARGLLSFSGTLLFFILNPLQNSGKWRVGKVISAGTPTYVNTDVSPVYNNATKFSIYYNKASETALFYIDDVLVHTMTEVNLPDTTNLLNKASFAREDSTETISTYACPIQQTLIFDLR